MWNKNYKEYTRRDKLLIAVLVISIAIMFAHVGGGR